MVVFVPCSVPQKLVWRAVVVVVVPLFHSIPLAFASTQVLAAALACTYVLVVWSLALAALPLMFE